MTLKVNYKFFLLYDLLNYLDKLGMFMRISFQRLYKLSIYLLMSYICVDGVALASEQIFQDARSYTVKVKSSVEYPIYPDVRGTRTGAGFLIDQDQGLIITNRHVSGIFPRKLQVMFDDQEYVDSSILYIDQVLDIAILKIPPSYIPKTSRKAKLNCKKYPDVGDEVGAFGHPFSLSFSGTRGIVSSIRNDSGHSWIQTDAAINSGNSGGPLIDLRSGKIVGVNTASYSKSVSEGVSFAIPMVHVCRIIRKYKFGEDPSVPYIPVSFSARPNHDAGLIVSYIFNDQPVSWPLQYGDEVIGVFEDGFQEIVSNEGALLHALRGLKNQTTLKVIRDGFEVYVEIPLKLRNSPLKKRGLHFSGVVATEFDYRDNELINPGNYLRINHVRSGSDGRLAGLRQWDYIVGIDNSSINDIDSLCTYLKNAELEKTNIRLLVSRYGNGYDSSTIFKLIDLEPRKVGFIKRQNFNLDCIHTE
tara:strand:+ start:1725 stop:3143 length:1419 start_codon:yes stop_codon:yes gene_type:complete